MPGHSLHPEEIAYLITLRAQMAPTTALYGMIEVDIQTVVTSAQRKCLH